MYIAIFIISLFSAYIVWYMLYTYFFRSMNAEFDALDSKDSAKFMESKNALETEFKSLDSIKASLKNQKDSIKASLTTRKDSIESKRHFAKNLFAFIMIFFCVILCFKFMEFIESSNLDSNILNVLESSQNIARDFIKEDSINLDAAQKDSINSQDFLKKDSIDSINSTIYIESNFNKYLFFSMSLLFCVILLVLSMLDVAFLHVPNALLLTLFVISCVLALSREISFYPFATLGLAYLFFFISSFFSSFFSKDGQSNLMGEGDVWVISSVANTLDSVFSMRYELIFYVIIVACSLGFCYIIFLSYIATKQAKDSIKTSQQSNTKKTITSLKLPFIPLFSLSFLLVAFLQILESKGYFNAS